MLYDFNTNSLVVLFLKCNKRKQWTVNDIYTVFGLVKSSFWVCVRRHSRYFINNCSFIWHKYV